MIKKNEAYSAKVECRLSQKLTGELARLTVRRTEWNSQDIVIRSWQKAR
jgi:hypothetical protein